MRCGMLTTVALMEISRRIFGKYGKFGVGYNSVLRDKIGIYSFVVL